MTTGPKHTYEVQVRTALGDWAPLMWTQAEGKAWCVGYVISRHDQPGVCLPSRVVRGDGKSMNRAAPETKASA